MASKIFASATPSARQRAVETDTVNLAGGKAYALSDKESLAQMAVTGVFNDTFYASAGSQLDAVKALVARVEPEFIAKLALYARRQGYMKDLPAYLCAVLAQRDVALLARIFDRVIDNGKMLRNFVQIIRSGQAGRKSLGNRPKKLVARWLETVSDDRLLAAAVGNSPSLADVIHLSHPKANDDTRNAFFAYILGKKPSEASLPGIVTELEGCRRGELASVPKVPFELLTSLPLTTEHWTTIARNASWTQTRMNLNTFLRHGVFEDKAMIKLVADRLRDPAAVRQARVFPYQLLAAFTNVSAEMPKAITNALQDAMELAVENVPTFEQEVAVLVDTSGSMGSPVTGQRGSATSKLRCVDVAGLFASAVLRKNDTATVVPFDTRVHDACLNGRDSVMTNAQKLAKFCGGGTDCGAALAHLNQKGAQDTLVIYVSDNESWVDGGASRYCRGTSVMREWERYKRRVPSARLVCIDITPNQTTQAKTRSDILNIGGFSDNVFSVVQQFANSELGGSHWVAEIEKVEV
jgi:60 kDa SS-A/Ro ribonucleoprotein